MFVVYKNLSIDSLLNHYFFLLESKGSRTFLMHCNPPGSVHPLIDTGLQQLLRRENISLNWCQRTALHLISILVQLIADTLTATQSFQRKIERIISPFHYFLLAYSCLTFITIYKLLPLSWGETPDNLECYPAQCHTNFLLARYFARTSSLLL